MLSGITIILRNDIRDIKNYVQSVVDKDPNYKEVHGQVSGSENVIRGNIDVEALLAKDDKKIEDANTASNINNGYDNYTPTQTVTDDISNKPSNIANNSSVSGETSSGITSNNKPLNNYGNVNTNDNTNNSNDSQKEEITDRSSFNGKDIIISEGEPFNPMNGLQLVATDINGKNITNKIVITENNVDTYKPGLYTVKANVTLSNENTLEKEFLVRVEPTILNLAVNDLKISKDVLEKNEHFNLTFAVKSSKSYLEVASVNINNKDYTVNKVSSGSFLRKSDKYEVDLVSPVKGGTEKIQIKSVTMSDGTIVDVDKSIEIEILKEEAQITDVVIKNISNEQEKISLEYNLNINLASVEGESQITGLDNQEQTQDVKITGNIMDDKGNMPVTNFKVTVPTTANFTVNKSGNLIGPTLQVINEGRQEIDVYANNFKKVGNGDIEIISEKKVSTNKELDRKSISLKLVGSEGIAYLSATKDGNGGVSENVDLSTLSESGVKLLTLSSGNETPQVKRIDIQGKAGIKPITKPESDKFILTLKIKKRVNE